MNWTETTQDIFTISEGIIIQSSNSYGFMRTGFGGQISKRWPKVQHMYSKWKQGHQTPDIVRFVSGEFKLGNFQIITVQNDLFICNLVSQVGNKSFGDQMPISWKHLVAGLYRLNKTFPECSFHMPALGTGNGGGNFHTFKSLAKLAFKNSDRRVYLHLKPRDFNDRSK